MTRKFGPIRHRNKGTQVMTRPLQSFFSTSVLFLLIGWSAPTPAWSQDVDSDEKLQAGQSLLQQQEYAKAAEQFQKCVDEDKEAGSAWFLLGYSLHMDGQYEKAIKAHKRAMEFDGESFQNIAVYNLACALALTGKPEESQAALEKAVAAGFEDAEKIYSDSDLYALHPTSGFAKLVAKLNGEEKLVEQLDAAQQAIGAEDFAKASEIYRSLAKDYPDNDFVCYRLGYSLHGAGKLDDAIEYHKKAAEFPGTKGIATYNWGCVLSLQGDKDAAIKKLTEAVKHGFVRLDAYENDPDLNNIREEAAFKELVDKVRGHKHGTKNADDKDVDDPDADDKDADKEEMHEKTQEVAPMPFSLGVKMRIDDEEVVIEEVIADSAAERDGLKAEDLIQKIGGKEVAGDPLAILKPFLESGDKIPFEVVRGGKTITIDVKPNRRK